MEAGFQAHVSKPIEPAELVRVVLNLVDLDVLNLSISRSVDLLRCASIKYFGQTTEDDVRRLRMRAIQ